MKDKTIKQLGKELSDVFVIVWSYIVSVCSWVIAQLQKISWAMVQKVIGATIVVISSIFVAIEIITGLLLIGDPAQTERLIAAITGIQLFDYVTLNQYVLFMTGGVIFDLVIVSLLMWFGIWLYGRTNWFNKPKKAWVYALLAGFVGLAMMVGALFYAGPQLVSLGKELHVKHHQKHLQKENNRGPGYRYYYPNQKQYEIQQREFDNLRKQIEREIWY